MADNNATDAGGNTQQLFDQINTLPGPTWLKWLAGALIVLMPYVQNMLGKGVDQQAVEEIVEKRMKEYDQNARARENSLTTKFDGQFYSTNAALARQYGLCIGYTDDSMRLNRLKSLDQSLTLKYSNGSNPPPSPAPDRPPIYHNREEYHDE